MILYKGCPEKAEDSGRVLPGLKVSGVEKLIKINHGNQKSDR